jgi:hypothetical protein
MTKFIIIFCSYINIISYVELKYTETYVTIFLFASFVQVACMNFHFSISLQKLNQWSKRESSHGAAPPLPPL